MGTENGRRARRQLTAEVKLRAVREARQGGVAVSQVCTKYQIQPGQFYQWEKRAEQAALVALRGQVAGRKRVHPREEELVSEVQRLQAVIAELTVENLQLKKGRLM